MPDTDTLQWIALAVLAAYVFFLAHVTAGYAKENRKLWQTHLGHEETD